ncbi:MAG: hypothetical protein JWP13_656 [Candidatus Saccharibacteria bacterium]|nr:hypothetical protein [Candidatus Saccharibacteria bacterium]
MKKFISILPNYLARISAAIIALMPFHAFMTVWLSSGVGHYTLVRLWKEILLLLLLVGAGFLFVTQPKVRAACKRQPLIGLMCIYVLFVILVGGVAYIFDGVSLKAYTYGVLLDSRYLVFFCVTWLATQYSDLLVRFWKHLLLIPAAVVAGIAALQYTVLPADFLRHFGYGPDTIRPTLTIDQKDAYKRVQSTLRGPNPFGAYLVVVLSALSALLLKIKNQRLGLIVLYVLAGLALVFTFSRSAWLGALASTAWLLWMAVSSMRWRKVLLVGGAAALVSFGALGYLLRENDHFQNVFFHTNEHSQSSESSNFGHAKAVSEGLKDIARQPWGSGTGTAGPASVYNASEPRIAENYFVQIGQEIGIVGLSLFLVINILVSKLLWQRRRHTLASVLLASFIGITVINLLMHAWADDTLAYIWWGLAGAAVALPIAKEGHEVAS